MIHCLLWSGGIDSTVLLYKFMVENPDTDIYTYSVKHCQIHQGQQYMENLARKRFLKWVGKKKSKYVHHTQIELCENGSQLAYGGAGQSTLWFSVFLLYINNNSIIHTGYIRGDDFWFHKNDINDLVNAYCRLKEYDNIKLEFDLQFFRKSDIIRFVEDNGIPNNCYWYCESPKKVGRWYYPCPHDNGYMCECCLTHKTYFNRYKLEHKGTIARLGQTMTETQNHTDMEKENERCSIKAGTLLNRDD